ncbi:MAG: xanthine phosphoribosyltransferase [Anaerolineaceae bacterium]|nr:xanthine phosphoribosyltransferase [Anaerolineaceae bacterium]
MKLLQDRIVRDGKVLPGNIIKVDGFLNHRVDINLLKELAEEFYAIFAEDKPTIILTVEASGIALAAIVAERFGIPMLFAKKAKSDNIEGGLYKSEIFSYTYKKTVNLIVSAEWLTSADRVLVIDDFLANGEALRGVIDIAHQANAEVVGVGVAVEKGFQPGGQKLRDAGYKLHSLAIIDKADENGIIFREE